MYADVLISYLQVASYHPSIAPQTIGSLAGTGNRPRIAFKEELW